MTDVVEAAPPAAPAAAPAAPAAAPVPGAAAPPAAPAAAPTDDEGTILAAADVAKPLAERIPEKHRVLKEDGTLDLAASLERVEDSRAALEKRLGTGDVRPKSADEYKLEVPEDLKPLVATLPEEGIKAFQAKVFAEGLTQKQYEFVMREYLQVAPTLVQGAKAIDRTAAIAELKGTWPDASVFDQNVKAAGRAVMGYAGEEARSILNDYGNDPRIVRMMAKIGAEMGEDKSPRDQIPASVDTVDQLRASDAYRNPRHVDHAKVSAQVAAMNEKLYGRDRVA